MADGPNAYLAKLAKPKEKQAAGYAESLMEQAGDVMIAERMWLVTQRVTAVTLSTRALSNVWWPTRLTTNDVRNSRALVLWLNSSLGALLMIAHRVPTRGPWISFKKPSLEALPVLNVIALSEEHLELLEHTYEKVCKEELLPFAQIAEDKVRAKIDGAFARVLGVDDLSVFAEMLGREPVITNKSIEA
jgi:hypothetical protein